MVAYIDSETLHLLFIYSFMRDVLFHVSYQRPVSQKLFYMFMNDVCFDL